MSKSLEEINQQVLGGWQSVLSWFTSPKTYAELVFILIAIALAFFLASVGRARIPVFRKPPEEGPLFQLRSLLFRGGVLVFPLLSITFLSVAMGFADSALSQSWLIKFAQGIAVICFLYTILTQFIKSRFLNALAIWIGIPVAILHLFGWLDDITRYLDDVSLTVGNIRLSLYALIRTLIFGSLLFWLGRISNSVGKRAIRNQVSLNAGTREVFAKLFEISLFIVVFLLLLQILGINLTALAVFGGALGVGIGFGLQQIASNFVSGIIILLDRSITIGDHIQLEDGRSGILRELNMRCGVIETYDGKDIMVPNEKFITSSYTNWTHKDPRQRYSLEFQVAYSTDLDLLFDNVRELCTNHPKVLSGDHLAKEFQPDAEIAGFGDSGIDILVEFWMEGIDEGENRVGADLFHAIWRSIQEHGMEIPFPQREVRILGDN
ncbi:MAG: Mechanosensitive channel MscK [Candidatus Moanabacter tarae]|uniref:Mechanosensitive channel MscK n=1 Tax=Candidatus Moanibacter tarae TaxID=2200854 RepID=A0A2Z4ANF5_9BACT|nr:MAG: Mechanosensitive channel MscK [Candidatus Moanabacter tarae]|tara:strand:- start:52741 stop:54048 length:1308 start_codon:yes stop_codon:yes gene_type:complete